MDLAIHDHHARVLEPFNNWYIRVKSVEVIGVPAREALTASLIASDVRGLHSAPLPHTEGAMAIGRGRLLQLVAEVAEFHSSSSGMSAKSARRARLRAIDAAVIVSVGGSFRTSTCGMSGRTMTPFRFGAYVLGSNNFANSSSSSCALGRASSEVFQRTFLLGASGLAIPSRARSLNSPSFMASCS